MASFKIFRRGGSAMSGILNVLGMAVAFAAFYIILVQVDYDLNFNKGIKDSERVFVLGADDWQIEGKKNLYYNRPMAETALQASPNVESYVMIRLTNLQTQSFMIDPEGERRTVNINVIDFSGKRLDDFGFEAVAGSFDDVIDYHALALSEKTAERFGLEVGSRLGQGDDICTVAVIFKNMPQNSHFGDLEILRNIGDKGIDNVSEWGYNYFVKVYDPEEIEATEEQMYATTGKCYKDLLFKDIQHASGTRKQDNDNHTSDRCDSHRRHRLHQSVRFSAQKSILCPS